MFERLFGKAKAAAKPSPPPSPTPTASQSAAAAELRDTLFGDLALGLWPAQGKVSLFPWSAFVTARERLAAGDKAGAIQQWRELLAVSGLEPRHYLQAWHFLRQHGEFPAADVGKQVFGVVVEVGMPKGLDLLAAYPDHSARYYNFSGGGVVWERPDGSLDSAIDALLAAAAELVARIGPWDRDRPPSPANGQMRLNFLTPSGLHFGQAPINALAADPMAGKVVRLATTLMQMLVAKSQK